MPHQNRVSPFEIIATPERGTCMGNRGRLHNHDRRLTRPYSAEKRWIICKLQFKDRHRTLMTPGHYTELFFLDEATALAAGHRPCAECNRPRFNTFKTAWQQAHSPLDPNSKLKVGVLDSILDTARLDRNMGQKVTYTALLDSLPSGTFITLSDDAPQQAYIVLADSLHPWTFAGYGPATPTS